MLDADWVKVRDQDARFGWRADTTKDVLLKEHHYDWAKTTSISISGTKFPAKAQTFATVSIVKKSFGGSFSKVKPSLKL